ncbi:hypothetical protein BU17DRAFT_63887 [Hysterangium stoloniferum]|nr:hypothetical protein BU17DRAFT_63887 [Hysterangium stoloniferum]
MSFQTTGELSEWYKVMFTFSPAEISYPSGSQYLLGCHPRARRLRNIHIFGTSVSQVIAALSGAYSYVQGIASNDARVASGGDSEKMLSNQGNRWLSGMCSH